MILGTAAYMSPEQARGRGVDRRTDIWSFGCVVFECLSGRPLFAGETVSDLIAKILQNEPDWSALPAGLPPRLVDLLRRCLRKNARERLRDIGDGRLELEEIARGGASPAPGDAAPAGSRRRASWPVLAAAVILTALATAGAMRLLSPGPSSRPRCRRQRARRR